MTQQELVDKINKWSEDAGESFTDYFMHDNVKDNSWAFWLLGKGYIEHANKIINEILAGNTCIDQELLYEIYPEYDEDGVTWICDSYEKNVQIWAEFLLATPYYFDKVMKFFQKY